MSFTPRFPVKSTAILTLAMAACVASAEAQTVSFDNLPDGPGAAGLAQLVTANGGSRSIAGIVFDAATNADWQIVGNAYRAPQSSDIFAAVHSGTYALAGNAFTGTDIFGATYSGLTFSTSQALTSLYVGFDDNGNHSNDANSLTITAFGANGNLASITTALTSQTLTRLDTSTTFAGLAGVTGYRFTTIAADALNAAYGRAYVIADDLTFAATVPEPATWAGLSLGLALLAAIRRRSSSLKGQA